MQRYRLGEKLQKHAPIGVGPDDRTPLVPAARDVPDRTGMFQAERTGHEGTRRVPAKSGRRVGGEKVPRLVKPGQILYFLGLTPGSFSTFVSNNCAR
jgi:hypothetical protein